ncbi:hypothetical protein [Roseibaca sp. Y0-43]|uniref:hypothetical protein n=1 Tax=Roseibaca sp. Y0-43 TaxID=2816854 RepID=UPI001D0BFE65|nr:hypothetical protein [Roseibaca sp. Y0-43]MCC1482687.1 hypothetical protein [Roseibaca sp. Y0-43]
MNEDDVRQAVDQLISLTRSRGKISQKAFDTTCEDYLVRPEIVASRFLLKTGKNWYEYRLSISKKQSDNIKIALKIALDRFERESGWFERYKPFTGSLFTSRNRKYVYIGSRLDIDGDLIHYFIRVKDLQTMKADWSDIHCNYQALGEILFDAK